MDCDSPSSVALLSIHPHYATLLMEGTKGVEFRKTKFRERVQCVVVYASSPIRKVMGYFWVKELVEGSPDELWERFRSIGGIEESAFRAYYSGTDRAIAIVVEDVVTLENPLDLAEVKGNGNAPQSYEYLRKADFQRLSKQPTAISA